MVMTEMSQRRPAHVLIRGNYQAQGDATQRLSYGFQLCVARLPDSRELGILDRIYTGQLAKYQANPDAAEKLIKNGSAPRLENVPAAELAAWTTVANTLLNLDETITRE
jgi:hypothetical protein